SGREVTWQRGSAQLLQALDQVPEALFDRLLEPLKIADARGEDAFQAGGNVGALGRTATARAGGAARAGLAATAPALRTQGAEDRHRGRIETPRPALPLVRQAVGVEAHVAHQRRIGDVGFLTDLSERQEARGLAPRRRFRAGAPAALGGAPPGGSAAGCAAADRRGTPRAARGPCGAAAGAFARATLGRLGGPGAALRLAHGSAVAGGLARPSPAARIFVAQLFEHRQRVLRLALLAPAAHRGNAALECLLVALQGRHGDLRLLGDLR